MGGNPPGSAGIHDMPETQLSPTHVNVPDMPPVNVVLLEGVHDAGAAMLENEGFNVERRSGAMSDDELIDAVRDAHVLGIRSKTQIHDGLFEHAPNLLGIGCFCIGTNQVNLNAACRHGVAVFNAPFSSTRSVAELTLAEIIALHRRLNERSMQLHQGHWVKSAQHAHEVRGRTLGIVGYGHIGSQLSVLAETIGMRVKFYDIATKLPLGNAESVNSLESLLEQSDVVSLHVPATSLTENMMGSAELECMRAGSFLINNARGSIVDLHALRAALERGHLGGAAVDVYPDEPAENDQPFTCPLAGLPNVILTPHVGGSTEEAQESIAQEVAIKLVRLVNDGSTATAVNVPQVDLPKLRPDQHRILHFHHNVPGVLGKMHTMLAELGVNINAEYLQSNTDVSYVILDIDPAQPTKVRERLEAIDETIRVRTLW